MKASITKRIGATLIGARLMAGLALVVTLVGCDTSYIMGAGAQPGASHDDNLIEAAYGSADRLVGALDQAQQLWVVRSSRVLYTSLVQIDDLDTTSRLGQMLVEHMASRLAQPEHGLHIVEARLREKFAINGHGEFMLSRELAKIAHDQQAGYVLVGTYAAGGTTVQVSVRLIKVGGGELVASDDFSLPRGPNTGSLLEPAGLSSHRDSGHILSEYQIGGPPQPIGLNHSATAVCAHQGAAAHLESVSYGQQTATGAFTCRPH